MILSGGSGTRLWPISTPTLPKQFAPLLPGDSLFVRTLNRVGRLDDCLEPIVVTGQAQVPLVEEAAASAGARLGLTIVEPSGRNTAPACLAAALVCDPDDTLVILPSDHLVGDSSGFADVVAKATAHAAQGLLVVFGVEPTGPRTGYGYIEVGESLGHAHAVRHFKEKPAIDEATRLASDGMHLWNSGMFVAVAGTLLSEAAQHCPRLLEDVRAAIPPQGGTVIRLEQAFADVEAISLDHAIMERTDRAAVIPIDIGWDDVGSFDALWSVSDRDADGNATSGAVVLDHVSDSLIKAESRTVAVAGLSGIVVVETPEAVLVIPRDKAEHVKGLADEAGRD